MVDGLFCHRIRREIMPNNDGKVTNTYRMWLARDRNLIPIRSGFVPPSRRSDKLPTGICAVTKLEELEPGIWMPISWKYTAYNGSEKMGLSEDRMIENWRRDFQVDSARLNPEVDPKLFETVIVPQGTKYSISDDNGNHLGRRIQLEDGNLSVTDEEYRELQEKAKSKGKE